MGVSSAARRILTTEWFCGLFKSRTWRLLLMWWSSWRDQCSWNTESLLNPHPAWKCSLLLSTYQIQSLSSICSKSICFQVSLLHSASDAVIQWLWFSMRPAAVPASAGIRGASTDQASCPSTQAGSVSKPVPSRARCRCGAGLLLARAAVGVKELQRSQVSLRRKMGSWRPAAASASPVCSCDQGSKELGLHEEG